MYGSDTNDNGTGHPDKNDNNPPKGADKNDNSGPESMETTTNGDNANKKPEPTSMEATTCTNNSNGNMNLQPLETNNLHVIDNLRSQTRNTDNSSSDVNGNPSTRPTPVEGDNNLEGAAAATSEEASATKVVGPIVIEATMEESETDTSSTTSATEDIENMEALDLSAHGSSACVRETYHPPSPMDLEPAAVPSQPHVMFQTEVCNALSRVQQGTTSGAAQVQQIEAPALEQVQEEVIPERQHRIEVAPQSCRMTQNQTQQGLPLRPQSVIQHTSTLAENAPFNAKPPQRDAFLRELLSKPVPEDPVKKTFDKLYRETPSGSGNPTSGQPGPSAIPGPSTQPGPSAQPGPSTSAQPVQAEGAQGASTATRGPQDQPGTSPYQNFFTGGMNPNAQGQQPGASPGDNIGVLEHVCNRCNPLSCQFCWKVFATYEELCQHLIGIQKSQYKSLMDKDYHCCKYCVVFYKKGQHYRHHNDIVHCETRSRTRCSQCGVDFRERGFWGSDPDVF